jgi:hypothetical protein
LSINEPANQFSVISESVWPEERVRDTNGGRPPGDDDADGVFGGPQGLFVAAAAELMSRAVSAVAGPGVRIGAAVEAPYVSEGVFGEVGPHRVPGAVSLFFCEAGGHFRVHRRVQSAVMLAGHEDAVDVVDGIPLRLLRI